MADVRLLYLTAETCPTFRADVTALFGHWLPRWGIYSDVVTGRDPAHSGPVVWGGGKPLLCDFPKRPLGKNFHISIHCCKTLAKVQAFEYDAVLVRDMPILGLVALVIARLKGLPYFYWMSYPIPEGNVDRARRAGLSQGPFEFIVPGLRGLLGILTVYRAVLPWADHVFVTSDRMKDDIVRRGIAQDRVTAVPMGVDLEALELEPFTRAAHPQLATRRVLVYLGTLEPARSIEILFDALALIRVAEPRAILVIVGDTKNEKHLAWLKQRAREAGVEPHVVWTGWLSMVEAWRYVRGAEVAFSPIPRGPLLDVGSPTKAAEYLALGVPVVGNDNPDQAALIRASGAGLCVPYDGKSFADAAIQLLNEPETQRAQRVAQGRAAVAQLRSYEVLSRRVAGVFRSLLGRAE